MNETQRSRFADALSRLANEEEILSSLASIASEDAPGLLQQLDAQCERGNWDCYANTAHAVKGLLSTFETKEPVNDLQPVIQAARQDDGKTVKILHAEIRPKLDHLVREIKELAS